MTANKREGSNDMKTTNTVRAGNGLESIPANDIEIVPGMKVQYFDIANQNSHIQIVTAVNVSTANPNWLSYDLLDTITGKTDKNTLTGFGWTVVRSTRWTQSFRLEGQ